MAIKQYRNRQDEEQWMEWQWGFYDNDLFDLVRKMIERYAIVPETKMGLSMFWSSIIRRKKYYGKGYEQYMPGEKLND